MRRRDRTIISSEWKIPQSSPVSPSKRPAACFPHTEENTKRKTAPRTHARHVMHRFAVTSGEINQTSYVRKQNKFHSIEIGRVGARARVYPVFVSRLHLSTGCIRIRGGGEEEAVALGAATPGRRAGLFFRYHTNTRSVFSNENMEYEIGRARASSSEGAAPPPRRRRGICRDVSLIKVYSSRESARSCARKNARELRSPSLPLPLAIGSWAE